MPYNQSINPQNQPSTYANYLSTFAKAATVFVTSVGGYALARASGVFSGWGSEINTAESAHTDLVTQSSPQALSQSNSLHANEMQLSSFDLKSSESTQPGLTAFTEKRDPV